MFAMGPNVPIFALDCLWWCARNFLISSLMFPRGCIPACSPAHGTMQNKKKEVESRRCAHLHYCFTVSIPYVSEIMWPLRSLPLSNLSTIVLLVQAQILLTFPPFLMPPLIPPPPHDGRLLCLASSCTSSTRQHQSVQQGPLLSCASSNSSDLQGNAFKGSSKGQCKTYGSPFTPPIPFLAHYKHKMYKRGLQHGILSEM